VKRGELSDSNKLFLQRVHYLNGLNKSVAANQVNDVYLNEKSQKKMFFPNIFMNSEEFKDLGTLHYEKRNSEYYNAQTAGPASSGTEFFLQPTAGVPPAKKWKQK
jgi:hypothetical protein